MSASLIGQLGSSVFRPFTLVSNVARRLAVTSYRHQPEAQHQSPASNRRPAEYPIFGSLRRFWPIRAESAFHPIATIQRTSGIGGFVPTTAVSRCSKQSRLFDHLVGAGEECGWHGEAEGAGGL